MDRFDVVVSAVACKASNNSSSCNPPRARNVFVSLLMIFLDGQHIRQSSL